MAKSRSRSRRRWVSVIFVTVVVVMVLILRLVEEIGPEGRPGDRFVVVRIIDGDTMELQGGDRLRLLALDTPEEGELFYAEASQLTTRLSLGRMAQIEFANRRRDKYGRLLGYLYIDSLFVNKIVIDSGYGYVYLFRDNELHSEPVRRMLEAQRSAIARKVGIWSIPHEPEPRYINLVSSFRLHRPNCRSLKNPISGKYREFATREEGLVTGLSPCRNCKP